MHRFRPAPVVCCATEAVAAVVGESPIGCATHPAFAPIARWLAVCARPSLATLNGWARECGIALPDGQRLRFVAPSRARRSAIDYERRIAERGEVLTRPDNTHDLFN